MQHLTFTFILISFMLFSNTQILFSQCNCTITYDGSQNNVNLNGGETFCIPNGFTFTGNVNNFASNSIICVQEGGTLSPSNLNNPKGTIYNYGTSTFQGISLNGGVSITNEGTMTFNSNVNLNGTVSFTNTSTGRMYFNQSFSLANNSTMNNEGELTFSSDFNTNAGTSLQNYGNLYTNQFNPSGIVANYGLVEAQGFININSNSTVENYCTFYSHAGFNNNSGNTKNYGVLYITNGTVQLNSPFYNGPNAKIVGIHFINSSTFTGGGDIHFSGTTRNNSNFGTDNNGINFYDSSSSGSVMDENPGTIGTAVTNNAFSPVDNSFVPTSCNYKAAEICDNGIDDDRDGFTDFLDPDCGLTLPVELESFEVKLVGEGAALYWNTASELNNDYFEIEHSTDAQNWRTIDKVLGMGTTNSTTFYEAKDRNPSVGANYYRLKQVDFDGQFEYSEIRFLEMGRKEVVQISVYPQPATDWIQIEANQGLEDYTIQIINSYGRVQASSIDSNFRVDVSTLKPGMYILLLTKGKEQIQQKIMIF